MTDILIVEDDNRIAQSIARYLELEGFDVAMQSHGEGAIAAIQAAPPTLVVLDLMLPGIDGIGVAESVRPYYTGGILMLTASDDEADELIALKIGVDDFVSKPVRLPVLTARIHALLRRLNPTADTAQRIVAGDLTLDRRRRMVSRDGRAIPVTETEFEVLWILAKNRGEPVSRATLFEAVLGREYNGLDRSIDMQIHGLRKKLGDSESPQQYIRSLRARGYLLL